MVLDTSALLGILFREEGYEELLEQLRRTRPHKVAAPTWPKRGSSWAPGWALSGCIFSLNS